MCTVLIAEDDKTLRNNLMQFLSDEGYKVLVAENGEKAFMLAQKNIPDIIVSDINMPLMSGYELMENLKNNTVTSGIPLIFITAQYETVLHPETTAGAKALITKPFKLADLLDKIELIHLSIKHPKSSIINNQ